MQRRHALLGALAVAGLLAALAPSAGPQASSQPVGPSVVRAGAWDALFDRQTGWTGADGIYSIPLSGRDALASATRRSRTLFVFSDTFIGQVAPDGRRLSGTVLVNNTLALLDGARPDPGRIHFYWGRDPGGQPAAAFRPATPGTQPGDWYWLMDGLAIADDVHLFALRMRLGGGGVFNFAVSGVALITLPLASADPLGSHSQVDAPLHLVPADGRGELIFGAGILANTAEAGAPFPDGHVYVFGTQNDPGNKRLLVARVQPDAIADFAQWRFWNGAAWSVDLGAAAPVTERVSSELSVTPLADGRYVLVFQLDTLGRDVALRLGDSPVGPFGPIVTLWRCPEPDADPDIYCYNAKAHPHLSRPGELLVSYNVNTFSFGDHFASADIYRPRFLRVPLPGR